MILVPFCSWREGMGVAHSCKEQTWTWPQFRAGGEAWTCPYTVTGGKAWA